MFKRFLSAFAAPFSERGFQSFLQVFLAVGILYRLFLVIALFYAEAPPFGIKRDFWLVTGVVSGLAYDIVILVSLVCLYTAVRLVLTRMPERGSRAILNRAKSRISVIGRVAASAALLWHSLVLGSHFNLLFTMNTGFTWSIFVEFFTILSLKDFFALMTWRDYSAIFLPQLAFFALIYAHRRFSLRDIALTITLGGMFLGFSELTPARRTPRELTQSPHIYFLENTWQSLTQTRSPVGKAVMTRASVAMPDPLFNGQTSALERGTLRDKTAANVVVIILESTAREYIFDRQKYAGGRMPMPYLHALSEKSLHLTRHFASNNSSPRSIFSIFSGLYESPETRFFSMERDLNVPHLLDILGKEYTPFLVTPADLNWYFPRAWFKNRGFSDLQDYNALKQLREYKAGPTPARDEFESVDHFNERVRTTREPFLSVYYTFVGHWPYPDIGADHRIIQPMSSRDRYINNLYAQDQLIEKIISSLETSGRLQRTIVVIVGDHGEAFYQHPGNRVHSGESYNENIASPLIIYSPKLIEPKQVIEPTVHADIVPTLLDAMGIAFRTDRFQGESLLRGQLNRNFIFTYGNENTLTSVGRDLRKMQVLHASNTCRSFDLATDAAEQRLLACDRNSQQFAALQKFYSAQPGLIKSYNKFCAAGCWP